MVYDNVPRIKLTEFHTKFNKMISKVGFEIRIGQIEKNLEK